MATINKTENMRIKSSKSAKITSAKPEILEKRTKQLQKWREENPELFYNQCTAPMIKSFQSKPERILFNYFSQLKPFNFKRNQFIKSKYFTNFSKKKQVDIIDLDNRIYIEFDGKVHFKPIFGDSVLLKTKLRDQELEKVITSNNWILIRISYDQFVYTTKNINKIKHDASYFKPESLQQIEAILKSKQPGVYKIGEAYNSSKS
jgi:very-short-patch-repair endonuclease